MTCILKKVICKVEKQVQYICIKTGDEGSIYAARQGMRVCNNTNMRNPHSKKDVGGLHMLVLLHALMPVLLHIYCPHLRLAAYILPSSPVLLHIYCPHLLSCCIYSGTSEERPLWERNFCPFF